MNLEVELGQVLVVPSLFLQQLPRDVWLELCEVDHLLRSRGKAGARVSSMLQLVMADGCLR